MQKTFSARWPTNPFNRYAFMFVTAGFSTSGFVSLLLLASVGWISVFQRLARPTQSTIMSSRYRWKTLCRSSEKQAKLPKCPASGSDLGLRGQEDLDAPG